LSWSTTVSFQPLHQTFYFGFPLQFSNFSFMYALWVLWVLWVLSLNFLWPGSLWCRNPFSSPFHEHSRTWNTFKMSMIKIQWKSRGTYWITQEP
jgi:hypothetical protein